MVGYNEIRDLFAQHGKPEKVFVQRVKKEDRRWRFGFVRFESVACVEMAIKFLDGLKVGGTFLVVKKARFPFLGVPYVAPAEMEVGSQLRGKMLGGRDFREGKLRGRFKVLFLEGCSV